MSPKRSTPWISGLYFTCDMGWTESTGHGALLITRPVVEPTKSVSTRLWPLTPNTTRSMPLTTAYLINSSCGRPAKRAVTGLHQVRASSGTMEVSFSCTVFRSLCLKASLDSEGLIKSS